METDFYRGYEQFEEYLEKNGLKFYADVDWDNGKDYSFFVPKENYDMPLSEAKKIFQKDLNYKKVADNVKYYAMQARMKNTSKKLEIPTPFLELGIEAGNGYAGGGGTIIVGLSGNRLYDLFTLDHENFHIYQEIGNEMYYRENGENRRHDYPSGCMHEAKPVERNANFFALLNVMNDFSNIDNETLIMLQRMYNHIMNSKDPRINPEVNNPKIKLKNLPANRFLQMNALKETASLVLANDYNIKL